MVDPMASVGKTKVSDLGQVSLVEETENVIFLAKDNYHVSLRSQLVDTDSIVLRNALEVCCLTRLPSTELVQLE